MFGLKVFKFIMNIQGDLRELTKTIIIHERENKKQVCCQFQIWS